MRFQIVLSMSSKLTLDNSFILYMKHDNVTMYVAFMWNWSNFALCHDTIFIASCVNRALEDEIQWPTLEERLSLGVLGLLMAL